MEPREMLSVLPGVLQGYRYQTYRNLFKLHRQTLVKTDPDQVYKDVKQRLMQLRETVPEKQARAMQEFDALTKGNLPAAHWEPLWEHALSELQLVGLARSPIESYMKYVGKVGKTLGNLIGKDLKMRPNLLDPQGPEILRKPATWQEAHAVLKEHEAEEAQNKALHRAYTHTPAACSGVQGQQNWWSQAAEAIWWPMPDQSYSQKGGKPKGKGKGKDGGKKGKAKERLYASSSATRDTVRSKDARTAMIAKKHALPRPPNRRRTLR